MQFFKKLIPHLIVTLLFIVVSLTYFSPVLSGKKLFQSDIAQYTGMAKQQNDFRKNTNTETYWTDAAFGGMPTYQLGAHYPHNYIKKLDSLLRFLPRPADYLFLYFIGLYVLLLVLKVDYRLAALGALAFGFSTYLIIILGVGHNAKAHAIAYMPLVLSGIILVFNKKYFIGFILTTLAMALELQANHYQMTYYLLLLVLILGIVYFINFYTEKKLPQFFKSIGILAFGVVLAIGLNATVLLATKEYAAASTRGKTTITINPDGTPKQEKNGLDYSYITEYSYGILESFNLFIPRFMGGGSSEALPADSKTYKALLSAGASPQEAKQIAQQIPMYWGDQPIVAAPAYLGATIFFLAVLGLFLVNGKLKWWLVSGFIVSLLLSWGKNFPIVTDFFIEYVPLYNKFRAVSSIQVIIELVTPILAVLGLQQFFFGNIQAAEKKQALIKAVGVLGGIILIILVFKNLLFSFASPYDAYFIDQLGLQFVEAVRADRMSLLTIDAIRSLLLILITAGVLFLYLKQKLKISASIIILAVILLFDLVGVDKRYVNNADFVSSKQVEKPFTPTLADLEIAKDTSHFRVYDVTRAPFNSGRASYFHKALGGYHAAKLKRIQDIYDFYLEKGDVGILNMLNVKYIITEGKNGTPYAQRNPYANGPAWFIENVIFANDDNQEILLLDSLDTKKTAVIHKDFKSFIPTEAIKRDSAATIKLEKYKPNELVYKTKSSSPQVAIFSEIYYPKGWKVFLDEKPATFFRANYILRAMQIPAGEHTIEFKFEPEVVKTGSKISLVSALIVLLLLVFGIWFQYKKRNLLDEI